MLGLLALAALVLGARGQSNVESITSQGYPAEEHSVITEDGYILSLQRIPYGKNSQKSTGSRKVVLLMHGILGSFKIYTYLGPEYGMAYNLADAGFDVWIGNARGNGYSYSHVSLDPVVDKLEFFNFSYEEIGLFDLPAMVDYILSTTKCHDLHYIGHSQGGSIFFVLNSLNTKYQSKFASAHLLTATGYIKYYPNVKAKILSGPIDIIYDLALRAGIVELQYDALLTEVIFEFLVNSTVPIEVMANAALKQPVHYMQNFRDESFRRFDYGTATNKLKYGSCSPPWYDLSKIKVNVTLHYTLNDIVQNEADVLTMVRVLPNAIARKVANDDFNHMDFVIGKDTKKYVTDYIIKAIKNS